MLAVVLTVLKIIGIVLLCVLGIVLFVVGLVLFVPIRYRIEANKFEDDEKPFDVTVKITWLLHLVNALFRYPGEELFRLRIMVFTILKKGGGKDENPPEHPKKKKKNEEEASEPSEEEEENAEDDGWDSELEETPEEPEIPDTFDEITDEAEEAANTINEEVLEDNPTIRDFIGKVFSFIRNIKFKILSICDKIRDVCENIRYYLDVIDSKTFRRALSLVWKSLGKLLFSIRPRKIRGNLHFGAEMPDTTAQVLGYYSCAYPWIGKEFVLIPHFEEEILKGDIFLRGKITVFTIVFLAAKVYFNKDVKRSLKLLKKESK